MNPTEIAFVLGLALGTIGGALVAWMRGAEIQWRAEQKSYLLGRNAERYARGDDPLVPPPLYEDDQLWRFGAADQPPTRRSE